MPEASSRWTVETLTCERVRATVVDVLRERGCGGEPPIVAAGPQGALGHELGHGPIHAGVPVIIDIFPRHEATSSTRSGTASGSRCTSRRTWGSVIRRRSSR